LQEFSDWWLLVPLLLWVGWRTYHTERRKVLDERVTQEQAAEHDAQPDA
jgi:hypothetical protein